MDLHFKSNQPYASRPGGPTCKASKGSAYAKHRTGAVGSDFQGTDATFSPENGFHYVGRPPEENHSASRDCRNGHLLNCYGGNESILSHERRGFLGAANFAGSRSIMMGPIRKCWGEAAGIW